MPGSKIWWMRQVLLVGTSITAFSFALRSWLAFQTGEPHSSIIFLLIGLTVAIIGGYTWHRYRTEERMEVIEDQIY